VPGGLILGFPIGVFTVDETGSFAAGFISGFVLTKSMHILTFSEHISKWCHFKLPIVTLI